MNKSLDKREAYSPDPKAYDQNDWASSRMSKDYRRDITSHQSKSRLSRMNSKMSLMSSKKKGPNAGMKLKIDEVSKQIQEMKLNLDKNLEDVRVIKNAEIERKQILAQMKETVSFLQNTHDQWNRDHNQVKIHQQEIREEHQDGMKAIREVTDDVNRLYKDMQKMISLFRKEYKNGFERIVRCEILLNEVRLRFIILIAQQSYQNDRK